ncbi:MAG: CarD family transcriptional regulator [Clostridiales bacterium]|nr:CarD family transcriptional regulator [Clostridiales bacterium]
MYGVGAHVVHPMHGAGVIEDIVQEHLNGQCGTYYVFRLPASGLVLKIPAENCHRVGLRALLTVEEFETVFACIPQMGVEMTDNWNRRYRENMDKLKSGDLREVAGVIKGLMRRDHARGLSNVERKMLHSARHILLSEMALVREETYDDAARQLDQAMMAGVEMA